jgi:two-component system sensor histidine kinase KdpD
MVMEKEDPMSILDEGPVIPGIEIGTLSGADEAGTTHRDAPESSPRRLVVAVGPSPFGPGLLRRTRRLADILHADWDCLTVEDGQALSGIEGARLKRTLDLATSLGARVRSVASLDVVEGIVRHAKEVEASFIVIGKHAVLGGRRWPWKRSVSARIMEESGDIPVLAVRERLEGGRSPVTWRRAGGQSSPRSHYAIAALVILVVTLINLGLLDFAGYWGASLTYLAAVGFLALFLGRLPVLLAALASAILWDFLFIQPRFTLWIGNPADVLMFVLYFLLALSLGWFMQRLRASEALLRLRESRLDSLGSLASALAGAQGRSEVLAIAERVLGGHFEAEVVFLFPDGRDGLTMETGGWQALVAADLEAARQAIAQVRATGRDTDILGEADWRFLPLEGPEGVAGAVGLRLASGRNWQRQQEGVLGTMLSTIALALERTLLTEAAAADKVARESERIGDLLLDSVSHELRTPMTVILGNAMALEDGEAEQKPETRHSLLAELIRAAVRLEAIVGNLLSMSRLQSGMLRLKRVDADPEELASAAIAQTEAELGPQRLELEVEEGLPLLDCDAGLIVTLLVNLLRNAVQHGTPPLSVRIGKAPAGGVRFAVEDGGPGVREGDLGRIFAKFQRGAGAPAGGSGLGLAICRGVVEAHGGSITAENRPAGGFRVVVILPGTGGSR